MDPTIYEFRTKALRLSCTKVTKGFANAALNYLAVVFLNINLASQRS